MQVKEDTPDVLPDGSRLYCLPSVSHNQHRLVFFSREVLWMKATHRAITAHTMAEVLEGRYNHKIRSVRIIDCRYCLLKITFVRINANMFNVQLSIFKVQI